MMNMKNAMARWCRFSLNEGFWLLDGAPFKACNINRDEGLDDLSVGISVRSSTEPIEELGLSEAD